MPEPNPTHVLLQRIRVDRELALGTNPEFVAESVPVTHLAYEIRQSANFAQWLINYIAFMRRRQGT